jgi:hypothetical protein
MNFEDVRQIGFSFPGVEEHLAFGRPTLRVNKRFLACIAKIDPNTLCIKVPDQREREYLLSTRPEIYYLADHYANFECLLVRLPVADPVKLRDLFEDAWRTFAPKRLRAAYPPPE